MKQRILKAFFSSGLQAISVQILGAFFIVIIAKEMPKDDFGMIQWANAGAVFITTLLSFGMEQVVIRRIAASSRSDWAAAAFLFHNLVGSVLALLITLLAAHFFPNSNTAIRYLPLFFAAQAVLFLVMPLKQYLNAKHLFTPYGVIAVISNTVKIVLAILMIQYHKLSVNSTGIILLVCALFELLALIIYVSAKTNFSLRFKFTAYKKLIKESLPQYLSSIFDSSLSRLDYILLGMIATHELTAEYGIAYRAYEISRLPIVIIAPIILNIFSRLRKKQLNNNQQRLINEIFIVEIFFAMLIPLILNIVWSPLLNTFFDNKYGSSNADMFLILSICIPLHFFINLMWTIAFSTKGYKAIATITMFSAIINLLLNLLLIKYMGGIGAAIAYLITTLFQAIAYYRLVNKSLLKISLFPLFKFMVVAALVYYTITNFVPTHYMIQVFIATIGYILVCFILGWIKPKHIVDIKTLLNK